MEQMHYSIFNSFTVCSNHAFIDAHFDDDPFLVSKQAEPFNTWLNATRRINNKKKRIPVQYEH